MIGTSYGHKIDIPSQHDTAFCSLSLSRSQHATSLEIEYDWLLHKVDETNSIVNMVASESTGRIKTERRDSGSLD